MIPELDRLIKEIGFIIPEQNSEAESLERVMSETLDLLATRGLVYITHTIRRPWWVEFVQRVEHRGLKGVVMVDQLPDSWPRPTGCQMVTDLQFVVSGVLQSWHRHRTLLLPARLRRDVSKVQYSFFYANGGQDQGRQRLGRHMDLLGISRRALTSSPEIDAHRLVSIPGDPWLLNSALSQPVAAHRFDDSPAPQLQDGTKMLSWQYEATHHNDVIGALQGCHFDLAVDNSWDWQDTNGFVTEKMMWAFVAGVPCVWAANPEKVAQLERWGFSDSLVSQPRPAVTDLAGWLGVVSLLERLVMDSDSSQAWQDLQGERVYQNMRSVWRLWERLAERQHQQWLLIRDVI